MPLNSRLYECKIWHSRELPKKHSFEHRHFMFYLDLDEVEQLGLKSRLFGVYPGPTALYQFSPQDHLEGAGSCLSLSEQISELACAAGVTEQIEKTYLLTNVRIWGYVFNPVAFFFCYNASGQIVCCVAEVGNTFGEKKAYVLKPDSDGYFKDRRKKLFYVSPFGELEQDFCFDLTAPLADLNLSINTMEGEIAVVKTAVNGTALSFSDKNLLLLNLRYPCATLQVIAFIHLHAFVLWLKSVPFRRKEESPDKQVDVMRPHKSLRKLLHR